MKKELALISGMLMPMTAEAQQSIVQQFPWDPVGNPVTLTVGTASAQVALGYTALSPQPSPLPNTARVCNTGSVAAFIVFGTSSGVAATQGTGSLVPAGQCGHFSLAGAMSNVAAIGTAASSLIIESGNGRF